MLLEYYKISRMLIEYYKVSHLLLEYSILRQVRCYTSIAKGRILIECYLVGHMLLESYKAGCVLFNYYTVGRVLLGYCKVGHVLLVWSFPSDYYIVTTTVKRLQKQRIELLFQKSWKCNHKCTGTQSNLPLDLSREASQRSWYSRKAKSYVHTTK